MKLLIFTLLLTGLASCQPKPVRTVFESAQKDTASGINETKVYALKKQTENSDFNYSKLNNIDAHVTDERTEKDIMLLFEPKSGRYRYYQFLSTYVGEAYNVDGPSLFKDFHDVLIIKTDHENKILDAYHYTLEWAEPPLQYDVLKSSAKNIYLTNNMDISRLKLTRTLAFGSSREELKENGIIKLNYKL